MAARPYDVVMLDVGGVLVGPRPDVVERELAAAGFAIDPSRMVEAHLRAIHDAELDPAAGGSSPPYDVALARRLGVDAGRTSAAAAVLWRTPGIWAQPLPGAVDGLTAIAVTEVPIVLVSNADGTVAEVLAAIGLLQVGPGPGTEVAAIIDSGSVGVAKPDPSIFRIALAAVGATPDRALHVGDAFLVDVLGARAAGIRPILFDPLSIRSDAHVDRVAALADLATLLT